MAIDAALAEIDRALPEGRVVTNPDVLEGFAHDMSEVPPVLPDAVVRVQATAEVAAVMRAAHAHGVPVTPRCGGTGRVGGAVPIEGGIVLAFERMTDLRGIEREDLLAVVQPGLVTGDLHRAVEAEGLFYPPIPTPSTPAPSAATWRPTPAARAPSSTG